MQTIKLIPYPHSAEIFDGELDCKTLNLIGGECFAAKDFSEKIASMGIEMSSSGVKIIYASDCGDITDKEGYGIVVDGDGIKLSASTQAGLLYAFCSLRQLLFNHEGKLPYCRIENRPYLKHRGLLVDVGRYYFDKKEIMAMLEICYLHKLNVMHWHLTEDQGWRITIDKYPLLTEKGSKRSHTNFGVRPHGGYYTREDIAEIIAYANERNIQVIPEIDMPGHIQSAIACYPYLGCFGRKLKVATHWGIKHDPLCAGKESTYAFVFDVLDEVIEMFGGNTEYIHIGGDEVFRHRWQLCKDCRSAMAKEGLNDAEELQGYFMKRVCEYLVDKGMKPIMWNGVNANIQVHPQAVWQLWGGESEDTDDARRTRSECGGYLVSNADYTYLDFPYGRLDVKKAYSFNPVMKGFDEGNLLGAEISLWTEYVPNYKTVLARLLPRTCALSEAMWLKGEKDYGEFEKRLAYTVNYLKEQGFKSRPLRIANPCKLRGGIQKAWFNRRVLHWQGLHNLIDDAYVTKKYSDKNKDKE